MSDKEKEPDSEEKISSETIETEDVSGFPEAEQITSLLGEGFEMPTITQESEESAPSAEPEPVEDPETGESYYDEESQVFPTGEEKPEGEKDKKGRVFDPQLHAVDDNGNPKLNKKGYFIFLRKDKRGQVDTDAPRKAEHFETALLYFDTFTDTTSALLGDHWQPKNDDQRKSVARSIGKYLESEDAPSLNPRDEMLLKLGTYSAPRVVHTDTFDNFKLICSKCYMGVKSFWQTITGKKAPKRDTEKPEERPQAQEVTENDSDNTPSN